MQQRVRLDQGQQQPEITPQAHRYRWHQIGEPFGKRHDDPALADLKAFLESLPTRELDSRSQVIIAGESM